MRVNQAINSGPHCCDAVAFSVKALSFIPEVVGGLSQILKSFPFPETFFSAKQVRNINVLLYKKYLCALMLTTLLFFSHQDLLHQLSTLLKVCHFMGSVQMRKWCCVVYYCSCNSWHLSTSLYLQLSTSFLLFIAGKNVKKTVTGICSNESRAWNASSAMTLG